MASLIIGIALLFFSGHALNWFFYRTKVPDLLILIIIGYLLGPVFGALNANDFGKMGDVLSTIALVVILYEGGLHLPAKSLITSSLPAASITVVGFVLIVVAGTFTAYYIAGQNFYTSILLGTAIGSTSSAVVIPMLKPLSIQNSTKTILSLESAFTDVLTIVIFLVLLDSAALGYLNLNKLIIGVGPKTLMALFMGFSSACLWAMLKKRFSALISMAFAGEAWALLTYGVIEFSGHNGAIGVLALGFILSNLDLLPPWLHRFMNQNPLTDHEIAALKEVSFLLRTFFFMYLGLLIQFSSVKTVLLAAFLSFLIFITRFIAVRLLFKPNKFPAKEAMTITAMGPRGLACAVLATLPLQKGLEGGEWLQNTLFALIPMTILFTAIFVGLCESSFFRKKIKFFFPLYGDHPEKNENELHKDEKNHSL